MRRIYRNFLIFVCVCATLFMATFTAHHYWKMREQQVVWEQKKRAFEQVKKDLEIVKKRLARYEREQKEFETYFLTERDIPMFLDDLSRFARETDVDIITMRTQRFRVVPLAEEVEASQAALVRRRRRRSSSSASEDNPDARARRLMTLAQMPITMDIRGSFENIVRFFDRLRSYRQLISISRIRITSDPDDYPVLSCSFLLNIYSIKTLEELGAAP